MAEEKVEQYKAPFKQCIIVNDSLNMLSFDHQLSCNIVDYHQLSFTLNMFKIAMTVDDSWGGSELAHYRRLSCTI